MLLKLQMSIFKNQRKSALSSLQWIQFQILILASLQPPPGSINQSKGEWAIHRTGNRLRLAISYAAGFILRSAGKHRKFVWIKRCFLFGIQKVYCWIPRKSKYWKTGILIGRRECYLLGGKDREFKDILEWDWRVI